MVVINTIFFYLSEPLLIGTKLVSQQLELTNQSLWDELNEGLLKQDTVFLPVRDEQYLDP